MSDPKKTIQFNTPPQTLLSRTGMAAAKSKGRPVGGVPPVRIPPLDSSPIEGGGSMQDQAAVMADPTSPLSPAYSPELAAMQHSARPVIQEHQPSPKIIVKPPQQPSGRPGLSPETVEGLQAVQEYQKVAEAVQREAAAREEQVQKEAEAKAAEKQEGAINELRNLLGDDTQWSMLNNPERRKRIEARCDKLDIADIVIKGEIQQAVPIVEGKLVVVYRTPSGEEDLGIKSMLGDERGTDRYIMDKFTMMGLTLGVVSVNGAEFVSNLDSSKHFNAEAFKKKMDQVLRFPITLLTDIALNYYWFDQRVQRLLSDQTEALKNS